MKTIQHKFVEFIPNDLEDGVIYISMEYKTAVHNCVCGCGHKVVTPITPTDWRITFDGRTISLYPSIGNWNFECQSHYWITNNRIEHSPKWGSYRIEQGREDDRRRKDRFFGSKKNDDDEIQSLF
jgi:hypothetical protein